jgi:3-dehydroquinate dehydratase II
MKKKKNILIINGPNLNLLGKRKTEIYGKVPFTEYLKKEIVPAFKTKAEIHYFQSNSESEIIDKIHEFGFHCDGIVINAGAYSHTSIAIADAIEAVEASIAEVHISNIYAREEYRKKSYISQHAICVICGCGLQGYRYAVDFLCDK